MYFNFLKTTKSYEVHLNKKQDQVAKFSKTNY
jgi:hypothetical protein